MEENMIFDSCNIHGKFLKIPLTLYNKQFVSEQKVICLEYQKKAKGLWKLCVGLLAEGAEQISVIYYMTGFSMELYLKAISLARDFSNKNQEKLKKRMLHNLNLLLSGIEKLDEKDKGVINNLNAYYNDSNKLRYVFFYNDKFKVKLPCIKCCFDILGKLDGIVSLLLKSIK